MKKILLLLNILIINSIFCAEVENEIIVVSIPKSGTHLVSKCLKLLTKKINHQVEAFPKNDIDLKDYFFLNHLKYTEDNKINYIKDKYIKFFVIRDPRDQIVSYAYWGELLLKNNYEIFKQMHESPETQNENFIDLYAYKDLSFDALITELIINGKYYYNGFPPYPYQTCGIKDFYNSYLQWQKTPGFYTVKFENLVGEQGGGSKEIQINEIRNIAKHLNREYSEEEIQMVAESLFGRQTFREGKIGSWKKHFTEEHKKLFKEVAGQLLIDLGYEKDLNW